MPLTVKITTETKEKGVFYAKGTVSNPDGTEKGKASVLVRNTEQGPQLVVSDVAKTIILGNEVKEYRSHDGPSVEAVPELTKDVELTFTNLLFAI